MSTPTMTFAELASRYCRRQENTPSSLRLTLLQHKERFQPAGWMLLECPMLGSSHMGELTVLPYGPNNTFREPPAHPISPRGLASDMAIVVGIMPGDDPMLLTDDLMAERFHYRDKSGAGMSLNGKFNKRKPDWITFTWSEIEKLAGEGPYAAIRNGYFVSAEDK